MVEEDLLVILPKANHVTILINSFVAQVYNVFRRSFNVDSHHFWVIFDVSNYDFAFHLLIKWDFEVDWGAQIPVFEFFRYILIAIDEELNEANLERLSMWFILEGLVVHFNPHIRV